MAAVNEQFEYKPKQQYKPSPMNLIQSLGSGLVSLGQRLRADKSVSLTDAAGLQRMLGLGLYGSAMPQWLNFGTAADYAQAWEQCPPIVSVICGKANADVNGKLHFVYTPDNEGNEESVNLSRVPAARALHRLFSRPNPLQTWKQFRAQQKIYTQLFGFCPVLMVRPLGFKSRLDTRCMWNLPPQLISIRLSGKLFYQSDAAGIIDSVELKYAGKSTPLPVEDVLPSSQRVFCIRIVNNRITFGICWVRFHSPVMKHSLIFMLLTYLLIDTAPYCQRS